MSEPRENQPGYNAWGSAIAATPADACGATHMAGFSAAFDCLLPKGHTGQHESEASAWDEPAAEVEGDV